MPKSKSVVSLLILTSLLLLVVAIIKTSILSSANAANSTTPVSTDTVNTTTYTNSSCSGQCKSTEVCVTLYYGYYGCQAKSTITTKVGQTMCNGSNLLTWSGSAWNASRCDYGCSSGKCNSAPSGSGSGNGGTTPSANSCDADGRQYPINSVVVGGVPSKPNYSGYSKCTSSGWANCGTCTVADLTGNIPSYLQNAYNAAVQARQSGAPTTTQPSTTASSPIYDIEDFRTRAGRIDLTAKNIPVTYIPSLTGVQTVSTEDPKGFTGLIKLDTPKFASKAACEKATDPYSRAYAGCSQYASIQENQSTLTQKTKDFLSNFTNINQYSFCEGKDASCNKLLTKLDVLTPDNYTNYWQTQNANAPAGASLVEKAFNTQTVYDTANVVTFDKFGTYVNAFSPDKVKSYWQTHGYSSLSDCQADFNGKAKGYCSQVDYSKEQLSSSIDLGATLTTEAYALTVAPGLVLNAGGLGAGALTALGQAQVISTVYQTGQTASYCSLNGWDPTCQQQAARTGISWATMGTSQYANTASNALGKVANTVVSTANLAVDTGDVATAFYTNPETDNLTKAMSLVAVFGDIGGGILDYNQNQLGITKTDITTIKNDLSSQLSLNSNALKVADIPISNFDPNASGFFDVNFISPDVPADIPLTQRITTFVEDTVGIKPQAATVVVDQPKVVDVAPQSKNISTFIEDNITKPLGELFGGNKPPTEIEKILNQADLNVQEDYTGIMARFTENQPYKPKASAIEPTTDLEKSVLQKLKGITSTEEIPTFNKAVLDTNYAKTPISDALIHANSLDEARAILAREGVELTIVDDDFLPGNAQAWAPSNKNIYVSKSASNDWVELKSSLAHETTHIDMARTGDGIIAELGTGSYMGDAPISEAIRNVGQEDWAYVNGARAALNELENNPNLTPAQKISLQKKVDDAMKFYNWVVYGDVHPANVVDSKPSVFANAQDQITNWWDETINVKKPLPVSVLLENGRSDLPDLHWEEPKGMTIINADQVSAVYASNLQETGGGGMSVEEFRTLIRNGEFDWQKANLDPVTGYQLPDGTIYIQTGRHKAMALLEEGVTEFPIKLWTLPSAEVPKIETISPDNIEYPITPNLPISTKLVNTFDEIVTNPVRVTLTKWFK